MSSKIITRFAPSPTGYLHVGGARTALFNYLFAKKHGGRFLLRIEDTDRQRSDAEMTRQIFDSLEWLRLNWDGEVVHQADNVAYHRDVARELLKNGKAYRCFCEKAELEERRKFRDAGEANAYYYDGFCKNLSDAEISRNIAREMPFVIRLAIPGGSTTWTDLVHGEITVQNREIDDFIILRSDQTPIYHLAVVADDHQMNITHVIRGDDHISNTPKQIQIYRAMGWKIPDFAHVPLILGADKKRLSKRHGATAVSEYQSAGILSPALLNYLLLLGWSPGDDSEIFSLPEMTDKFSMAGVSPKGAVFDDKKLNWMNAQYLSQLPDREILDFLQGEIPEQMAACSAEKILQIISLLKPRVKSMSDFVTQSAYFFSDPHEFDPRGARKHLNSAEAFRWLARYRDALINLPDFGASRLEEALRELAEELEVAAGKIIHPCRLALTGLSATPGLFEIMEILGRDTVLRRLTNLITREDYFINNTGALNE